MLHVEGYAQNIVHTMGDNGSRRLRPQRDVSTGWAVFAVTSDFFGPLTAIFGTVQELHGR